MHHPDAKARYSPDGLKVRFKIRVESGKKAAALNAQQAEAIKEFLQWARQHKPG